MKKIIVIFSLILLLCSVIYSQSNTEIDKRLQKFYKQYTKTNRSVDGYFYINRTLYKYY